MILENFNLLSFDKLSKRKEDAPNLSFLQEDKIVVMDKQDCIFLKVNNICYIEGEGSYSTIFLQNGNKMMVSKNVKVFAERLSKLIFFRIHKSYLVNINFISKYVKSEGGYVIMENGATIPVSLRKRELLLNLIQQLSL